MTRRRLSPIELAIGVSLLGSLAAVAIPAFAREIHASRFVEPTAGLAQIGEASIAFAVENGRFPDSAPLTPAEPPRGKKEADPPGTWDHPTWQALGFRPAAEGAPHAYSFAYESNGTVFVAKARGDLDGDGILSLFEIRGFIRPGEKPMLEPGMHVESELE